MVSQEKQSPFHLHCTVVHRILSPCSWNGIWLSGPLPALCLPQGAWDLLGTGVHVVEWFEELLCAASDFHYGVI